MIKIILIISFCLINCADLLSQDTLVFASYNVENLFDINDNPIKKDNDFLPDGNKGWDSSRYEEKLKNLAVIIRELDADLLGLAEIENRFVLDDLVRQPQIIEKDYRIVHEESPDVRGIDVAFLYNAKVFQYIWHNTIPIYFPDEPEYKTRDILYIVGTVGKHDTLIVFMNHWPSRIGGIEKTEKSRVFVAGELRKFIDSMWEKHPDYHIIISGDFNDTPKNKSLKETLWTRTENDTNSENFLFNLSATLPDSAGTYLYRDDWYMYDQIIISSRLINNDKFQYLAGSVEIFTRPYLYEQEGKYKGYMFRSYAGRKYIGGYSDHLPVRASFIHNRPANE